MLAVLAAASSLPTGLIKRACWSSSSSRELKSFVMALPAGFSLWATPNRKLVVIANQASKNVSDRVLPAPKTPAMASVDRPVWRAEASESAMERMCGHCHASSCAIVCQIWRLGDNAAGYWPSPGARKVSVNCVITLQPHRIDETWGVWDSQGRLFFARVEALCVQVMHKSP